MRAIALAVSLVALGVAAGGCAALGGQRSSTAGSDTSSKLAQAQATHEYPSPRPAPQTVRGGASTPIGAVRSFAATYINWNATTVAGDMRALAAGSVGQARSAMQLAAAQTAGDYELRRGGIANSGTVEAVAPLSGRPNEFVVVTREATTASNTDAYQGLQPAWHVTLATVVATGPGEWAVSGWQPES
jgi:hypothetical protein